MTDKTMEVTRDAIFEVIWPTIERDNEYACRAVAEVAAQAAITAARPQHFEEAARIADRCADATDKAHSVAGSFVRMAADAIRRAGDGA